MDQIKHNELTFHLMLEATPNALVLVNNQGRIAYLNSYTERLFHYTKSEIIGKEIGILIPERFKDKHPNLMQTFQASPTSRKMGENRELFALKKDKSEFPVEIGLNPIVTVDGTFVLASIIDISERKKNEEIKKLYTEDIEAKNIELAQSEAKLKKLNKTKDKLFSIIGHDLRGPIGNFKVLIDLLLTSFDLSNTEALKNILKEFHNSTNSTYELLENLLTWAKSQQNNIEVSMTFVNIAEIAELSISLLESSASSKKITIHNQIPEGKFIYADRNMTMTIIRNLLNNAIKFTEEGKNIYLNLSKVDKKWLIEVKDEGVGISEENIKVIFDQEQNFSTYGTKQEKGSGLGLLLCKEFVEKMGGEIWVESTLGLGSSFKFALPMSKS